MGIDQMNQWMRQFGFGQKTGVDLPSESEGLYPSPEWKMRTRKTKWMKGETISVSIGQGAFTATHYNLQWQRLLQRITAHVVPHVLRASHGAKPFTVRNAPDGKINFNGTDEDWVKMREAMIDVIQSGTGRGIRTPLYQIAGKTGTAQVKVLLKANVITKLRLVNANLTMVFCWLCTC
jgi:penicillin-binding protein 2